MMRRPYSLIVASFTITSALLLATGGEAVAAKAAHPAQSAARPAST